ncbi:hypothetical protein GDO78_019985 [Eleutherodactylus coqui]|uniref:Uncharacterized protein n=1 Tax=Eleutherodactylus coqui TaxID=57060 RepID=A0A8J6C666_ELECQ|nr:hypothetical protein GDO78_019985 [Eleutherodactylus coqui]
MECNCWVWEPRISPKLKMTRSNFGGQEKDETTWTDTKINGRGGHYIWAVLLYIGVCVGGNYQLPDYLYLSDLMFHISRIPL